MSINFQKDLNSNISATDAESSSQSLCRACGLCCDGTLFRFANIAPDENIAELERIGITTICDDGKKFVQPCAAFDKVCTIYHTARAKVCEKYLCKLLMRHNSGEISYNEALEIIRNVRIHQQEIEGQFSVVCGTHKGSLAERYQDLLKLQEESQSRERAAAMVNFAAFKLRLDRHFKKPKQDTSK